MYIKIFLPYKDEERYTRNGCKK